MAQPQAAYPEEKLGSSHHEDLKGDDTHQIAERGHAATDM